MTFEELLGGLPRQTHEEWAARAEKEWRGRPSAAFAKTLGLDGGGAEVAVGPFAATSEARHAISRPARATWVPLSDLRVLGDALTPEDALSELEGGAQGLCLDAGQLPRLAGSGEVIRYDYLTLEIHGVDLRTRATLLDVVPEGQRAGVRLCLRERVGDEGSWRSEALAFPKARRVYQPPPAGNAVDYCSGVLRELEAPRGKPALRGHGNLTGGLALPLPSDYLDALTVLGAVDLLWANVCALHEVATDPLYLSAHVAPSDATETPEAYLIDASVRALAAVSAGVDALVITPSSSSVEHRRQARNLQQLMLLEAGLAQRPDVLTGAAWFEEAIIAVAQAAWGTQGND